MGKSVLITGVNGFLGRKLSLHLVQEGFEVYGIARNNSQVDPEIKIQYESCDILDKTRLCGVIDRIKPDIIFHFAALSRVGPSFDDPTSFYETNITGTFNLLEAVRIHNHGSRIIFSSSSEVYGQRKKESDKAAGFHIPPLVESQAVYPGTSPYSVSKFCAEYMMECYAQTHDLDIIIVRSFNIEGKGRGHDFATAEICQQAARLPKNLKDGFVIGNMATFRDFTHIADAILAYTTIALKGEKKTLYNLGSCTVTSLASFLLYAIESAGYTIQEIIFSSEVSVQNPLEMIKINGPIKEITKLDSILIKKMDLVNPESGKILVITDSANITITVEKERFRPSENPVMIADTARLSELGYSPRFSVKQIADDLVHFYQKNGT